MEKMAHTQEIERLLGKRDLARGFLSATYGLSDGIEREDMAAVEAQIMKREFYMRELDRLNAEEAGGGKHPASSPAGRIAREILNLLKEAAEADRGCMDRLGTLLLDLERKMAGSAEQSMEIAKSRWNTKPASPRFLDVRS
ncbi:MAG: hypothetical protein WCY54_09965 [Syntrophales bacterium]